MKKTVLALGFFDSVHKGHKAIIDKTIEIANENGAMPAVLFLDGDLNVFTGKKSGLVFNSQEKKDIFCKLGIKNTVDFNVSNDFLKLTKTEFLKLILDKNVCGFVSGKDFTFGFKAEGNVDFLREYCIDKNITVTVIDDVLLDNKRISTRNIKDLLLNGNVKKANEMLITG